LAKPEDRNALFLIFLVVQGSDHCSSCGASQGADGRPYFTVQRLDESRDYMSNYLFDQLAPLCKMCKKGSKWPVTEEYNLAVSNPQLAREWHESNDRPPTSFAPHSSHRATWQCANGHIWSAPIAKRNQGATSYGCSKCSNAHSSIVEIRIAEVLARILGIEINQLHGLQVARDGERTTGVNEKYGCGFFPTNIRPDFAIPPHLITPRPPGCFIEFDPFFTHNGRIKRDQCKSELLQLDGSLVFRLRETGLSKIQDADMVVPRYHELKAYKGEQLEAFALQILAHLETTFGARVHRK
jgi:hypothetical protein